MIPSTGDREAILGRIAEALREEAPRHYETVGKPPAGVTAPFREWLPPVGETTNELAARFAQQSEVLKTEFCECASLAAAAKHVAALAKTGKWKTIALHSGELSTALVEKLPAPIATLVVDKGVALGDQVVIDGAEKLRNGSKVAVSLTSDDAAYKKKAQGTTL